MYYPLIKLNSLIERSMREKLLLIEDKVAFKTFQSNFLELSRAEETYWLC